jgi:hypothetical protein
VWKYKLKHPCINCGEKDVRLLDPHHRDPSQKKAKVSDLASSGASIKRIQEELDKCDMLCVRCHRLFHWSGYYWSWNYC